MESISAGSGIDCEFSRRDAYVYTRSEDRIPGMKTEVAAAASLRPPSEPGLPFDSTGAVKFSAQTQFHPRKFLLPPAQQFVESGRVRRGQAREVSTRTGPATSSS